MLRTRILSALTLIPLIAVAAFVGGYWFAALIAAFAALATIEFYQISRRLGAQPSALIGTLLTITLVFATRCPERSVAPALFVFALGTLMVIDVVRQDYDHFLANWATTLIGSAYVGGMLGHFVLLRDLQQGLAWAGVAVLTTWVGDTAAYFAGKTIGKRPFFQHVSPRKTLEGAVGGLLAGTITGLALGVYTLGLSWPLATALGLVTSLAATFGDLAESLLKRQARVKDSGNLIPGHGGALDRVDSLLFSAVVVYYFAIWIAGAR